MVLFIGNLRSTETLILIVLGLLFCVVVVLVTIILLRILNRK